MRKCSSCERIKDEKEFDKPHSKLCTHCKDIQKRYYNRNRDKMIAYAKTYQKTRDKKRVLLLAKKSRLKIKYGITLEDYQKMYDNQGGQCAICKKPEREVNKELSVDHCHTTGKVRGLLCSHCNHGVGKFKDNIEIVKNLLDYLINAQNNQIS